MNAAYLQMLVSLWSVFADVTVHKAMVVPTMGILWTVIPDMMMCPYVPWDLKILEVHMNTSITGQDLYDAIKVILSGFYRKYSLL